ncbi:hypothetical protein IF1G_11330 [Cordyceps javanica]|uniref:CID domain-containing protein n=1 Tax=Cordyceps javanica TaxID=43265 RepID=A0A545UKL4_9HYPO|nr:hypothetical protein IF1G_11330 [Cordyceps javanica]
MQRKTMRQSINDTPSGRELDHEVCPVAAAMTVRPTVCRRSPSLGREELRLWPSSYVPDSAALFLHRFDFRFPSVIIRPAEPILIRGCHAMASAVTHLEYGLKSDLESMLSRKAPGASRSRINRLTTLCVANVEVPVLIPLLHAHFRKTPDTHKLSVLYVIDSVVRAWLLQARARNQDVSRPAPDGTHVAAVRRVTDLLPGLMRDMIQCAPDDQKVRTHNPYCYPFGKIIKLLDIWKIGKTFPAENLRIWRQGLTVLPHTAVHCARSTEVVSEGSRRFPPSSACTSATQHHAESPTTLYRSALPVTGIPGPAQRHRPTCPPETLATAGQHGASTPGAIASIAPRNTGTPPDHAALWASKSGQLGSSDSEVAQRTGKDAETGTCGVGGGPCLELTLQVKPRRPRPRSKRDAPTPPGHRDTLQWPSYAWAEKETA